MSTRTRYQPEARVPDVRPALAPAAGARAALPTVTLALGYRDAVDALLQAGSLPLSGER